MFAATLAFFEPCRRHGGPPSLLLIILFSFCSIYWNAKAAKGVNASLAAVLLMEKCDYFTSGQFFASLARSAMGRPNRLIKPFASN